MIGAGPAGLTYASLVADGNSVTVFERAERAGGAFRYAGKAPLFQEVVANQEVVRPLHAPARWRPARGKGVDLPLRHRRHALRPSCWRRSTAS